MKIIEKAFIALTSIVVIVAMVATVNVLWNLPDDYEGYHDNPCEEGVPGGTRVSVNGTSEVVCIK